jgi:SNF2 family DNA or RNA helicase
MTQPPRIIGGVPWYLNNENPAKNTPMKAQLEALRRSKGRRGYNWWLDVGLGKTTTALNEFEHDRRRGVVDFLAVVTLQSFKYSWPVEATEFGLPGKFGVWDDDFHIGVLKDYDGAVWNWESLIGRGGDALEHVLQKRNVYLVFDESHRFKNPQAKVTKRCFNLWKQAVCRRAMTGTPMSQSIMDLYPPLKLAGALEGVNPFVFRNRYAKMGGYMGKSIIGIQEDKLDDFQKLRDDNAFRAMKKDWLDLPPQTYQTITTKLPSVLAKHYKKMQEDFAIELDEATEITAEMVVTQLTKLQQITSGFIIDAEGKAHDLIETHLVPKFQVAADIHESLGGTSKLIVFTHFRHTVDRLIDFFVGKLNTSVCVMRGGMSPQESADVKARFNSDDGPTTLIAQASVAGEAHTLLGGLKVPCYTSYFVENAYNLRTRMQAEGRNHRAGQRMPVLYYDSVGTPVEKAAIDALQRKANLVQIVVNAIRGAT